jgi:hypothetical protein
LTNDTYDDSIVIHGGPDIARQICADNRLRQERYEREAALANVKLPIVEDRRTTVLDLPIDGSQEGAVSIEGTQQLANSGVSAERRG